MKQERSIETADARKACKHTSISFSDRAVAHSPYVWYRINTLVCGRANLLGLLGGMSENKHTISLALAGGLLLS
jgi:hypothetical protein